MSGAGFAAGWLHKSCDWSRHANYVRYARWFPKLLLLQSVSQCFSVLWQNISNPVCYYVDSLGLFPCGWTANVNVKWSLIVFIIFRNGSRLGGDSYYQTLVVARLCFHRCLSVHGGVHPLAGRQPLGRHLPPLRDGCCSGRYASYWNAFLFIFCLPPNVSENENISFTDAPSTTGCVITMAVSDTIGF